MKDINPNPSNRLPRALWLSIPVGLALLLLMILLGFSGASTPAAASQPPAVEPSLLSNGTVITIGVAAALSPPVDFLGWPQTNAVRLAISQTNAMGGLEIGGITYSLTVVTADSGCSPTQAVTATNTLLDAGAVAVVGHSCSSASLAAQELYNMAGVPMVSASSSTPSLTEQGYTTTFRVYPRDDSSSVRLARYFRQSLEMDAVALVRWAGLDWLTESFSNTFTSLGGTITSQDVVESTDDYTATLTAIQAENPDAVVYADFNAGNAGFLSSIAHNLGLSVVGWVGGFDEVLSVYAAAAGEAAEGDYAAMTGLLADDMPGYDTLNLEYQMAGFPNYGDELGIFGAYAYDAIGIILDAIASADSIDPAAIRDGIADTTTYDGVVGTYDGFDAKGDVIPQWTRLVRYLNGEWSKVAFHQQFLPLALNGY